MARIEYDLGEFRAARDRGDMRVAGQQFGILTMQMLEAVGGVAALTAVAGRGVGRLADAVRNGDLQGPAAGGLLNAAASGCREEPRVQSLLLLDLRFNILSVDMQPTLACMGLPAIALCLPWRM
ncbi:MAG: hypothetical protein QM772_05785 [Ottowia sp.]|uniref:hypothetical protein n=1 Tax=Ottowia sp. TaxID=1898956 RepID=UPI0039E68CB7